jgi:hypothetical protein
MAGAVRKLGGEHRAAAAYELELRDEHVLHLVPGDLAAVPARRHLEEHLALVDREADADSVGAFAHDDRARAAGEESLLE